MVCFVSTEDIYPFIDNPRAAGAQIILDPGLSRVLATCVNNKGMIK